jgi:hypothetical protein
MPPPITITEIVARSEQGATKPFFCYAEIGLPYRLMYCVKGVFAGLNSLCCEWVGSRLAALLAEGQSLRLPEFRIAKVSKELIKASARPDVRDLGAGHVFASLLILDGQELAWSRAQEWPDETMATLLLIDLWLQNEDRTLTELGGNPNLLCTLSPGQAAGKPRQILWAYDFNLAFDPEFDRGRFFGSHVFGRMLKRWPAGFRERMEPRLKTALGQVRAIFNELPREWLHLDGDESLPVQLDVERVISVLELPFSEPGIFWKLP